VKAAVTYAVKCKGTSDDALCI